LDDLNLIENEVFAQAGQPCCRRSFLQILDRSLKKLFVRQDGKRCCAGILELPRKQCCVEICANQPTRGRRLLEFGNDGSSVTALHRKRMAKASWNVLFGVALQLSNIKRRPAASQFLPRRCQDLV